MDFQIEGFGFHMRYLDVEVFFLMWTLVPCVLFYVLRKNINPVLGTIGFFLIGIPLVLSYLLFAKNCFISGKADHLAANNDQISWLAKNYWLFLSSLFLGFCVTTSTMVLAILRRLKAGHQQ